MPRWPAARLPRQLDEQRNRHNIPVVFTRGQLEGTSRSKRRSVIGCHDDQRSVVQIHGTQACHQTTYEVVDHADLIEMHLVIERDGPGVACPTLATLQAQ